MFKLTHLPFMYISFILYYLPGLFVATKQEAGHNKLLVLFLKSWDCFPHVDKTEHVRETEPTVEGDGEIFAIGIWKS